MHTFLCINTYAIYIQSNKSFVIKVDLLLASLKRSEQFQVIPMKSCVLIENYYSNNYPPHIKRFVKGASKGALLLYLCIYIYINHIFVFMKLNNYIVNNNEI